MRQRLHSRSSRLARKLSVYATSGASMFVGGAVGDVQGAIVHVDLGPDGVTVDDGTFELDLNNDALVDFAITHGSSSRFSDCVTFTSGTRTCREQSVRKSVSVIAPAGGVMIAGESFVGRIASKLDYGASIGTQEVDLWPSAVLRYFHFARGCDSTTCTITRIDEGYFGRGMLGLQFEIAPGSQHMAWADVSVIDVATGFKVFGYAYETEPGVAILAGDKGPPPTVPGDTNGDGTVDLEDLNNVRNNFGASRDAILGDTNEDDLVDLEDLNSVRNNFGAGNPVAEPSSLVLLAAGAAGLAALRRKKQVVRGRK